MIKIGWLVADFVLILCKLLVIKEALIIGEHNLKPLLAVHKRNIDW